jgi:hypothetical protein
VPGERTARAPVLDPVVLPPGERAPRVPRLSIPIAAPSERRSRLAASSVGGGPLPVPPSQ